MFTFREFILKESVDDLTVVPVSEEIVSSFEEINYLLDNVLTEDTLNPYIGWVNASKVLSDYGIQLPRSIFKDLHEGEEVVALSINESEYYFYYEYQINENGSYQTFATITDEQGLEELLKD